MEVSVSGAVGLPEGCILSVRAGNTRRQAPVPLVEPLRFPSLPFNAKHFKVDVMKSLGSARLDIEAARETERYTVGLDMVYGGQAKVDLEIREEPSLCGKRACELKQFDRNERLHTDAAGAKSPAASVPPSPAERGSKVACETMDYAKEHNIPSIVQEMLQHVLRERPADPYSVMSAYLRRTAEGRGEALDSGAGRRAELAAVAHAPPLPEAAPRKAACPLSTAEEAKSVRPPAAAMGAADGGDDGPEDLERLRLEADHLALRAERAALLQELRAVRGEQVSTQGPP